MSKAQDWYEEFKARPVFVVDGARAAAVSTIGGLELCVERIPPKDILRFAEWIVENFSEDADEKA